MSLANALINFNNKSDAVLNIRDRSLFISWGGGGSGRTVLEGDHLIFRRTKGGNSRDLDPKRGDHSNLLGK